MDKYNIRTEILLTNYLKLILPQSPKRHHARRTIRPVRYKTITAVHFAKRKLI
jgi:hypothetical protein